MGGEPAEQTCQLLALWAGAPTPRVQVLAEVVRRDWRLCDDPHPTSVVVADPGWAADDVCRLVCAFGTDDALIGFTLRCPAGEPTGESLPAAITITMAASRLWGPLTRIRPRWAVWDTPHGCCEISEVDGQVLVRWRHTSVAATGEPTGCGEGRRALDDLVAAASLDEQWPAAVSRAHALLGDAVLSSWVGAQVAALYVLVIAQADKISVDQITAEQLRQCLNQLRRKADELHRGNP